MPLQRPSSKLRSFPISISTCTIYYTIVYTQSTTRNRTRGHSGRQSDPVRPGQRPLCPRLQPGHARGDPGADERLSLRVWASDLREDSRGRQFDKLTEASVHPALPRERGKGNQSGLGPENAGSSPSAISRIPRNVGRRYAAVSGDVNPIHLNPFVAKLFGFRRAIAHGMWLKARCLAAFEGRLPDALTAEVEFKSPLLLPSAVGFASQLLQGRRTFSVVEVRSGRPHLYGSISED